MTRRSADQSLRDDPVFKAMYDDVVWARNAWPAALLVAHRDPSTGAVTFHLHVHDFDLDKLRDVLGDVPLKKTYDSTSRRHDYHFHGRRQDMDRLLKALGR